MTLSLPKLDNDALRLPQGANPAGRALEAAVYALLALFFAVITAAELRVMPKAWIVPAVIAFLCAAFYLLRRYQRASWLLPLILVLAAALRLGYIYLVPTQPVSDFEVLYSSAVAASGGDFSWNGDGYFSLWAYQIPFVLYEALIYKFTSTMAALKLMNAVWSVGSVYLIYRLALRFLPRGCALSAAFLYAVYPGQISYVPVLTNQHIAMFFLLLGLVLLNEARSPIGFVLSGASLAMSNLMRPEGGIAVIAIALYCLCCYLEKPRAEKFLKLICALAAVLLTYFLLQRAAELILHALGLAPCGLGSAVPEWKLIVGLNTSSGGQLTGAESGILSVTDDKARSQRAAEIIRDYFADCGNIPAFFFKKLTDFWTWSESGDFELGGVNTALITALGVSVESLVSYMVCAESAVRVSAYLLSAAGALLSARRSLSGRRSSEAAPLISAALMCGIVLAYLIVEIQPRYRYTAMPFVFLSAASALNFQKNVWKK